MLSGGIDDVFHGSWDRDSLFLLDGVLHGFKIVDPLVDIPVKFSSLSQNASFWEWDFGDFSSDNIENPTHTYAAESSYDVTLITNNQANCPDTITKTLLVNLPSLFLLPSAFSPSLNDDINPDFGLTTLQRVVSTP